ncbi:FtsX-like permease family protein, partial [Spirillospora sp. NPDC049652]
DRVYLWLADGTRASVPVAAVLRSGLDDGMGYLTSAHGGPARPGRVDVLVRPGADRSAVARDLRAATRGLGVRIASGRADAAGPPGKSRNGRVGILVTLGIALAYCAISVANSLAMAAADRARDRAVLRLSGATPGQVTLVAIGEAVVVVCVGVALAAVVSAVSLVGLWTALSRVTGTASLVVPWGSLAVVTAVCALVALPATLLPALGSSRSGVGDAGLRD